MIVDVLREIGSVGLMHIPRVQGYAKPIDENILKPGLYPERDCCRCASIPRLIHRELIASDWSLGLGIPGCAHNLVACAIIFYKELFFFWDLPCVVQFLDKYIP